MKSAKALMGIILVSLIIISIILFMYKELRKVLRNERGPQNDTVFNLDSGINRFCSCFLYVHRKTDVHIKNIMHGTCSLFCVSFLYIISISIMLHYCLFQWPPLVAMKTSLNASKQNMKTQ